MATTFCTSAQVLLKAGAKVNVNLSGGEVIWGDAAPIDTLINQHECLINSMARHNFIDNYATLNADTKLILQQVASDLAAIDVIAFDMGGYSSRVEAEDMINIRRDSALRGLSLLRDKKVQDFINGS